MTNSQSIVRRTAFSYLAKSVPTGFALIYTLVIARFLGPEDYGTFTYITALFGGFFLTILGGTLTNTVFVYTARFESKKFYKKIAFLAQGIAIIIALGFVLFPSISLWVDVQRDTIMWYGIIFLLLTPFSQVLAFTFKGFNRFDIVFQSAVIENVINLFLSVLFIVVFQWGLAGIFVAKFISIWSGVSNYVRQFDKLPFTNKEPPIKETISFIKWNTLGDTFRQAGAQLYTIFAGIYLSPLALGSYYLAQKIASATVGVPTAAASEILLTYSAKQDKKSMWENNFQIIRISFILAAGIGLLFWSIFPIITLLLFPQFEGADPLIELFVIFFVTSILTYPSNIFRTKNWMGPLAWAQGGGIIITITIGLFLTQTFGAPGLVGAQILSNIILSIAMIAWLISAKGMPSSVLLFRRRDLTIILNVIKRVVANGRNRVWNR